MAARTGGTVSTQASWSARWTGEKRDWLCEDIDLA